MILISLSRDPESNLFLEETLFRSEPRETQLVLYVNRPCVVIGRNQDPDAETRPDLLAARRIPLVRRFTGGGAVWHDPGNLNFSIIGPKETFDLRRNFGLVLDALRGLGFEPVVRAGRDILVQGKKISGNAYAHSSAASLHHGTLLVRSDLSRLEEYLRPLRAHSTQERKYVSSVRSEVTNLSGIRPVTMGQVRRALIRSFRDRFGPSRLRLVLPFRKR